MAKLFLRGSKEPIVIKNEEAKEIIEKIKQINPKDNDPLITTKNLSIRIKTLRGIVIE